MEKRPNKGISTFSAQITATISVALVLLLIGIIAMLGIAAHSITRNIKENIGFDIVPPMLKSISSKANGQHLPIRQACDTTPRKTHS